MTYFNTSDNPSGAARTVTIIANDGTLDSAPATDTINVTPVNDAPVVTAGHTLNYTENQAATAIDPALTVTDVDSANLASATVQITGNYVNGQDVLGFTRPERHHRLVQCRHRHADADRLRHASRTTRPRWPPSPTSTPATIRPGWPAPSPSSPMTAPPTASPRPTPSMSRRSTTPRSRQPAAR